MILVNVIYDEYYDEVDIIAIPKALEPLLDDWTLSRECSNWSYYHASHDDTDYWSSIGGKVYSILNTNGFIKWLNKTYCASTEKAYIVEENVKYKPELKRIDF